MIHHRCIPYRLLFGCLLALGLLSCLASPGPSADTPSERDKQIADIEKQIADLNRKLAELRSANGASIPVTLDGTIPADWINSLKWRSIGPAGMGGRITSISVFEADPSTYFVATASGGLLKTTNNGNTFEHQFDREKTVSIGSVCVAPSNRDIVWVGTGESNPRNSVSYGDGVYKSIDGGKKWTNMGLNRSFQIGKVLIHPSNPEIVYVGALGRLYGPNEERGLFKTTDGGNTWNRILYIDEKTGIIDLQMNPADPETLIVAAWERQRDGFDSWPGNEPMADGYDGYDPIKKWGPGSGLYKTSDGGKTFRKLTQGLPTCNLGRIGIDYFRKNPSEVFAIVDCEKIGMGTPPSRVYLGTTSENADGAARLTAIEPDSPAAKAGLKEGDLVQAADKKPIKNFDQLGEAIQARKAGDKITLQVRRDKEVKEIVVTLEDRPQKPGPGGKPPGVYLGFLADTVEGTLRLTQVPDDSPAGKAGLKKGDVLKMIDKTEVTSQRQIFEQLRGHKPGDKITVKILRDNKPQDIVLTLETRPASGNRPNTRPHSALYGGQRENVQNQQGPNSHEYGGLYKSNDGGESWTRINSVNPRPMYFSQVRVDPSDNGHVYVLGVKQYRSSDGGKTFRADGSGGVHDDQHALWIDPKDGRHMVVGCDGGFYVTHDRMNNWDHLNHLAIGQFYHVTVDSRHPYRAYGGLQDNGSWGGPSRSLAGPGPVNDDWVMVGGGDGFVCRVDPTDPDVVYFESQDGNPVRRNLRTGEFARIRPPDEGIPSQRYNWNTPFIVSQHNGHILYLGGTNVLRSVKRGADWRVISPEITRTKRGSATAIAESPRNPDVIYAGTDDGALWVTRDGGTKWTSIADKVGLPAPRWVATIEPSRFEEGRAYVVFDAHRSDDDEPYVYKTEDFGQTWTPLRSNLPVGSTRVLREDVKNPNLLYLGTEFGAWVSINQGKTWNKLNSNLPTVAVHEFAIHPTAGEIVAATHGRSLWVLDVTPLRQLTTAIVKEPAHLFEPNRVVRWRSEVTKGNPLGSGSRHFIGQNPPSGAQIAFSLTKKADKVSLKIVDYTGATVRELQVKSELGLQIVNWNLVRNAPERSQPGATPKPAQGRGRGNILQMAGPGMYRVVLTVDGKEYAQALRIDADPTVPSVITAAEEVETEDKDMPERNGRMDQ